MAKVTQVRVPTVPDRERRWHVAFFGEKALVRHYLILAPGEDIDDTPPEKWLSMDEWQRTHAEYGLNEDGTRIGD